MPDYLFIATGKIRFCHGYVSLAQALYPEDPAIAVCLAHTVGAKGLIALLPTPTPAEAAAAVRKARKAMDIAGYRAQELKAAALAIA